MLIHFVSLDTKMQDTSHFAVLDDIVRCGHLTIVWFFCLVFSTALCVQSTKTEILRETI